MGLVRFELTSSRVRTEHNSRYTTDPSLFLNTAFMLVLKVSYDRIFVNPNGFNINLQLCATFTLYIYRHVSSIMAVDSHPLVDQ